MLDVPFVFVADKFEQVAIVESIQWHSHHPWLCVRLRIFDGELQIEVLEIPAPEAIPLNTAPPLSSTTHCSIGSIRPSRVSLAFVRKTG